MRKYKVFSILTVELVEKHFFWLIVELSKY